MTQQAPTSETANAGADAARAAVGDLYVTSDLRHHTAQDFLAHVGAPALLGVVLLGIAVAGDFGYDYVTTGRYLESTDDAYVKADTAVIAAKDYATLVAEWMDELEASAPPPSTLAFSIHMRRQAARLVELLGG